MDATENEVEGTQIEGFPTLILYPKNGESPIRYNLENGQNLKDLKKWIVENSKVGLPPLEPADEVLEEGEEEMPSQPEEGEFGGEPAEENETAPEATEASDNTPESEVKEEQKDEL